jgi:hypothetical protein
MDNYGKFWISIIALLVFTVLGITYLSTNYYKTMDQRIVDMITAGVDPIAASCAMSDTYNRQPTCVIYATKSK